MKKKFIIISLTFAAALLLSGCSLLGISTSSTEALPLENGTTTGNILNYGFCVRDDDYLIWQYTYGDYYPIGSTIRSSADGGSSELLFEDGGLYMNLVDSVLYYCKSDGVYRADIEDPYPELVLDKDIEQLQIRDGIMYYIEGTTLDSRTVEGEETGFAPIENADCLNVYDGMLYYINTEDEYIYSAELDGSGSEVVLADEVSMFIIMDDEIYYIDGVTGYLVSIEMGGLLAVAIIEETLTGFNINRSNIYYTKFINGAGTCCCADADGSNEELLSDFGDSQWHITCMFDTGTLLAKVEEIDN